MSEVRSSKLETGLSVSNLREVRVCYALKEECRLDADTLGRFKDRFQFLERVRVCLPNEEERACHFVPREVCFCEFAFVCGLGRSRGPKDPCLLLPWTRTFRLCPTQS